MPEIVEYPLPPFHFMVSWGDSNNALSFSDVSGLTLESEAIQYPASNAITLTARRITGLESTAPSRSSVAWSAWRAGSGSGGMRFSPVASTAGTSRSAS